MQGRAAGGPRREPGKPGGDNRAPVSLAPVPQDDTSENSEEADVSHNDTLLHLLSESLKNQTTAIVTEVRALGSEVRALRMWTLGLAALAIVLLAGVVGVSVAVDLPGVGSVSTPAVSAAGAP